MSLPKQLSQLPAADPIVLGKLKQLFSNEVLIIEAATGAGKGVIIAPEIMRLSGSRVVITEPRTTNTHVAEYLQTFMEERVDYGYRFANNITKATQLAFVTDGFLANILLAGKNEFSVVIIDEVHERNKNIDILLTLEKIKSKCKVVLLSATMDIPFFERYFSNHSVGVLKISGRSFPIEHHWIKSEEDYVKQAVELIPKTEGDVLIFLTSASELAKACRMIDLPCFELHKGTPEEVKSTIIKGGSRRVIFSTNVAESGITINGITTVIDSGRRYESVFRPKEGLYELVSTFVSRAEIDQRAGRAGRTAPGICYHLYSEEEYNNFQAYKDPEIANEEISSFLLQILSSGRKVDFLKQMPTPPTDEQIAFGMKILSKTHLYDGQLSALALEVVKIPLDIQPAISLLYAKYLGVIEEVAGLLALISIDPVYNNWFLEDNRETHNVSEFYILLKYLRKFIKSGKCKGVQQNKMNNAKKTYFKLLSAVKEAHYARWPGTPVKNPVLASFYEGYRNNIGKKTGEYYLVDRPNRYITVRKPKNLSKLSKEIIFIDMRKIKGTTYVSGIFNI